MSKQAGECAFCRSKGPSTCRKCHSPFCDEHGEGVLCNTCKQGAQRFATHYEEEARGRLVPELLPKWMKGKR